LLFHVGAGELAVVEVGVEAKRRVDYRRLETLNAFFGVRIVGALTL
jgi:hypothetical protein